MKLFRVMLLGLVTLSAGLLYAAEPKTGGDPTISDGATVALTLPDGTSASASSLAGHYLLMVDKAGKIVIYDVTVTIHGPTPPPTPPVPPAPPVPPTPPTPPTPVKLRAVLIEETENSTQATAAIRVSAKIRTWAAAGGHDLFFLDQQSHDKDGNPPADLKAWLEFAKTKPLPYLVLVDKAKNSIVSEAPAPANEKDYLALLETYGGKQSAVNPVPSATTCPGGKCK
jgi:hypothetical protein